LPIVNRQLCAASAGGEEVVMKIVKTVSRYIYGLLFIAAGALHFLRPEFYMKIMPPYLPWHLALVYLSGVFEIALGALLLIKRFAPLAAWGLILLLLAVFPANIYAYQHQDLVPASPLLHLLRLPLQAVFILWAYWYTRPDERVPTVTATAKSVS
jgi:uncharacterized membrane protein